MRVVPKRELPFSRSEVGFTLEYLQLLKDHDAAIEASFCSYFKPRLKMKLSGRRLQDSDVEDVIQDTFLRTLKAVRDGAIKTPEAFGGYVSRVCDFVLYEKFREPSRWHLDVDAIEITNEHESLEQRVLDKERRKQVEKALATLRYKDRNLLRAKIFEELDNDEICERFGISRANLRVVLHRAVQRFAKACQKQGLSDRVDKNRIDKDRVDED